MICMRQREIPAIRCPTPGVLEAIPQAIRHRRHWRPIPHRANIHARLTRIHPPRRDRQLILHAQQEETSRGQAYRRRGALKVPPPPQSTYPTEFSQQPLAEAAASASGGVQRPYPEVPLPTRMSPLAQAQAQAPKTPSSA